MIHYQGFFFYLFISFPEIVCIPVLKRLCIFSKHKLMSVLYLQTSLDLMCYNQEEEEEEESPMITMCLFFLFSMECLGLLSLITYIAS